MNVHAMHASRQFARLPGTFNRRHQLARSNRFALSTSEDSLHIRMQFRYRFYPAGDGLVKDLKRIGCHSPS